MFERTLCAAATLFVCTHVAGQELLDANVAFRATAHLLKPNLIEVRYDTAPGYYIYRDRLAFTLEPQSSTLGRPKLPPGKIKHDEFFGNSVIYRRQSIVTIPVTAPAGAMMLTADLQGCADIGVCYPPVRRTFALPAPAAK